MSNAPIHPAYHATDDDRKKVRAMVGIAGLTVAQVAAVMGVSVMTIKRHYAKELAVAYDEATAQVAASLFKVATTFGAPGQIKAAEFWLRARAHWSTTDVLEVRASVEATTSPMLARLTTLDIDQLRSLEQITTALYDSTQEETETEGPREVEATCE